MPKPAKIARVTFDALERWDYHRIREYTYGYLTDEQIGRMLHSSELAMFELSQTWANLTADSSTLADNSIHLPNVAKLVSKLLEGETVPPVEIEAAEDLRDLCGYCVKDGHHRLRALKYLRVPEFDAILEGDEMALAGLRELCEQA